MSDKQPKATYQCVLRFDDDDMTEQDRLRYLRHFLKRAKRNWRLTCESIVPIEPEGANNGSSAE